ncbi:MAG TPA: Glu/Leu/Phe/Val dehydrogenase dimerization domain-containing protein [Candidatus Paceibacterota bacterium]
MNHLFTEVSPESLKNLDEFNHHIKIVHFTKEDAGLDGFIVIHRTKNNLAIGGTRLWPYPTQQEALRDALRLSRAMTYKCALANVLFGGGKGVIIQPSDSLFDRRALMGAYAEVLNRLQGFYTGEDVGLTQEDVAEMAISSRYLVGKPDMGGDPGPWAALSVYHSIRAALEEVYGNAEIKGRSFAVKGLGKVGGGVARLLSKDGGITWGADVDDAAISNIKEQLPEIRIVSPLDIHTLPVDVYVPCALGGEFDAKKVRELKCRIICGGANNQLAAADINEHIAEQGIWYVPDYVANAGGLMNVAAELDSGGYRKENVDAKVKGVTETVRRIFRLSREHRKAPGRVADEMAEAIFSA